VAARLKAHVQDASNNNMLIFPEGTCVNNDFAIMFKKGGGVALDGDFQTLMPLEPGAFDLGATVVPIAIKYATCKVLPEARKRNILNRYNRLFADAFWNSRKETFTQYARSLVGVYTYMCTSCAPWVA
jgi:glycerol-3-phosphate O-acyltransferase 3/4